MPVSIFVSLLSKTDMVSKNKNLHQFEMVRNSHYYEKIRN